VTGVDGSAISREATQVDKAPPPRAPRGAAPAAMPPRVVNANQTGGFQSFLEGIPPITRAFAGSIFVLALSFYLGLIDWQMLAMGWPMVYRKYQVWRLLTCHVFIPFSMAFVFNMLFLIKYGSQLETEVFRFSPADYLFMLICGGAFLLTVPPLIGFPMGFTAEPLIMMLVYVWSRNFPDVPVSLYGLVTIQSFYLPFAFLAISVLLGKSPVGDLFGIAAGHLWYFFTDLYPASSGRTLIWTPQFLKNWVSNMGVGPPPSPEQQQQRTVFRGRGQRLGTQ
ncbi:MAG: Der1-like family-domain-containing protein, partial [Monoraphidium minutum]